MVSSDKERKNKTKRTLLTSFKDAFAGYRYTLLNERNFQIHTVVTCLVVMAGFILKITRIEWLVILLCIALVLTAELLNTAIERVVDLIVGETYHELAKISKDVAAAAVILTALMSVIIGLIVFLPYIWQVIIGFI